MAVAKNEDKHPLFTLDERLALVKQAVRHLPDVEADTFDGLLMEYVVRRKAQAIVRGLRAVSDFEFEFQLALMNRKLNENIETIFMMPKDTYTFLSSRIVKEIARLGGDVSAFVPAHVRTALSKKFRRSREILERSQSHAADPSICATWRRTSVHLQGELPVAELDFETGDEMIRVGPAAALRLGGSKNCDDALLVTGSLRLALDCQCVRCLKPFTRRAGIGRIGRAICRWRARNKVAVDNDCVDLTPFVREDMLLEFPQHPLCKPDCGGLKTKDGKARKAAAGQIRVRRVG